MRLQRTRPSARRCGFSLLELLVVLAITAILTALMFPAFARIREDANRLVCSSNQRNIGMGIGMWANDNNERLPPSRYAYAGRPQEMMASHRGDDNPWAWEGIGHLFSRGYCGNNACFHCPSHHNVHTPDEYHQHYNNPGKQKIFTNYHYVGDWDWKEHRYNRLTEGENLALLTDGLRTIDDFNHEAGMNVLRADFSVVWREDTSGKIRNQLPVSIIPPGSNPELEEVYAEMWNLISTR